MFGETLNKANIKTVLSSRRLHGHTVKCEEPKQLWVTRFVLMPFYFQNDKLEMVVYLTKLLKTINETVKYVALNSPFFGFALEVRKGFERGERLLNLTLSSPPLVGQLSH